MWVPTLFRDMHFLSVFIWPVIPLLLRICQLPPPLMMHGDNWWCLIKLDDMLHDTWWYLMMLDDACWCLLMLDGTWWCLMIDFIMLMIVLVLVDWQSLLNKSFVHMSRLLSSLWKFVMERKTFSGSQLKSNILNSYFDFFSFTNWLLG